MGDVQLRSRLVRELDGYVGFGFIAGMAFVIGVKLVTWLLGAYPRPIYLVLLVPVSAALVRRGAGLVSHWSLTFPYLLDGLANPCRPATCYPGTSTSEALLPAVGAAIAVGTLVFAFSRVAVGSR